MLFFKKPLGDAKLLAIAVHGKNSQSFANMQRYKFCCIKAAQTENVKTSLFKKFNQTGHVFLKFTSTLYGQRLQLLA